MKAFHAYDIRGIYNQDFNKEDVYRIGYFLPQVLNAKKILIGRDIRTSSPEIFKSLKDGLLTAGADVFDMGLSTTPMVYWSTAKYNFDASVMITASHNAKEYNGLKVSGKDAKPIGYDSGLNQLEKLVLSDQKVIPQAEQGRKAKIEVKSDYLKFQQQYLTDISGLKIAIDCSNGMAGLIVKDLLRDQPNYINFEPDGTFPAHDPNPLVEKNVEQLKDLVKKENADIGIIYDGDADRVMFVDEKGNFISPDLIIALLGHYFLKSKKPGIKVIQDIRSSKSVGEYLSQFDAEMFTWRVGRAYAAPKLKEINGLFGGELAGHYYFKDFYYSDSAMMASLIVLGIVSDFKKQGISLSQLIKNISKYESSGEINFKIEQKKEAMEAVKNYFLETESAINFMDFDGYRIEFKTWWFNIRPSNTEPYLRLLVEAEKKELLEEKLYQIKNIINKFHEHD